MSLWNYSPTLEDEQVALLPLCPEHRTALLEAAADGNLWELWYTSVPSVDTIDAYLETACSQQKEGRAIPFVVWHKEQQKVIGSTRFCNLDVSNRRLEIGFTWYAQSYQRTAVNTRCKLLLLQYAFSELGAIAVEFRTHAHNHRSRKAIRRLGAKQDGILRNHRIDEQGRLRDTVVFSIIQSEWPTVQFGLSQRLLRK